MNGSPAAEHESVRLAEPPAGTLFESSTQAGGTPAATVSETVAVFDVCSVPAERKVKESGAHVAEARRVADVAPVEPTGVNWVSVPCAGPVTIDSVCARADGLVQLSVMSVASLWATATDWGAQVGGGVTSSV